MFVTTVEALRSTYAYFSTNIAQPCTDLMHGSGKVWQALLAVKSRLCSLPQFVTSLAQRSQLTLKHNLLAWGNLTGEFSATSSPLLALPPEVVLRILSHLEVKDQIPCLSSCTSTTILYEFYTNKEKETFLTAKKQALLRKVMATLSSKSKIDVYDILFLGEYFMRQAAIVCHTKISARERYMASRRMLLSIQPFKNEKACAVQAHLELALFRNRSAAQILSFLRQLAKHHLALSFCLLVLIKKIPFDEKINFLKATAHLNQLDTHLLQVVSSERYLKENTLSKIFNQLYYYCAQG
jgi:hypothetical protein